MILAFLTRKHPCFSADGGGAGGGAGSSDGTQNTGDDPSASAAGDQGQQQQAGAARGNDGGPADSPQEYTQAELDRIRQEAFDKGRNLGFAKGAEKKERELLEAAREKGWTDDSWAEYQKIKDEQKQAEHDRLAKEGQFEQILKTQQAEFDRKLAEERQRREALEQSHRARTVRQTVTEAAVKAGILPNAVDQVASLVGGNFRVREDSQGVHVEVVNDLGEPLIDHRTGRSLNPVDFLREYGERNPHFMRPTNGSTGGSGTRPAAGAPAPPAKGDRRTDRESASGRDLITSGIAELSQGKKRLNLGALDS